MHNLKHFLQVCSSSGVVEAQVILQNSFCVLPHSLQRRYFFGFRGKHKAYHGRQLVGYSSEQMFDVVADVKNYKHFVPFCKKSVVVMERPDYIEAALEINFPPIVESYTSRVVLVRSSFARIVCVDLKLFNHLVATWKFSPALKSNPRSCIVDLKIDFEFKSVLYSSLAYMFIDKVVKQMEGAFLIESAFLMEAKRRYGKETLPSRPLAVRKS